MTFTGKDRSKTYEYNLWHTYIKIRWRHATFVLFFIAKATKFLENKTRELGCYLLFILNKEQTKKVVNKKRNFHFFLISYV